jgi:hypothetical protein
LSRCSAVDRLCRHWHQVFLIHESFFLFIVCGCPVVESCSVGGSDRFLCERRLYVGEELLVYREGRSPTVDEGRSHYPAPAVKTSESSPHPALCSLPPAPCWGARYRKPRWYRRSRLNSSRRTRLN